MRRVVLTILLLVFAAPSAAHAATVTLGTVNTDPKYGYESPVLVFTAASGEANRITVAQAGTGSAPIVVLRDAGAPVQTVAPAPAPTFPGGPVQARAGCTAIDERTVSCAATHVFVDAGDGDDTVTLQRTAADASNYNSYSGYVRGGDGADVLSGPGFLAGGPGNDVLTCPEPCAFSRLAGGPGDDALRGGNANDVLSGDGEGPAYINVIDPAFVDSGAAGNDRLDGGPGRDQASFSGQSAGVRVDLAAGTSTGAGGERDTLAGIEDAAGGNGDDLLLGDARDNVLEGDAGDDRLSGRGGDDHLLGDVVPDTNEFSVTYTPGTDGADTLHGGAGDDTLDAGGEAGDALDGGPGADRLTNGLFVPTRAKTVRCGSGRDTIDFAPQGQRVSGCELLRADNVAIQIATRPQRRANGRLRFVWACRQRAGCRMAIGVRVGSSKIARRRLSLRGANRSAFSIRPVRPARRGDVVDVTIIAGKAPPYAARWRVVL